MPKTLEELLADMANPDEDRWFPAADEAVRRLHVLDEHERRAQALWQSEYVTADKTNPWRQRAAGHLGALDSIRRILDGGTE